MTTLQKQTQWIRENWEERNHLIKIWVDMLDMIVTVHFWQNPNDEKGDFRYWAKKQIESINQQKPKEEYEIADKETKIEFLTFLKALSEWEEQ